MNKRAFLNADAAKITDTKPRQVIAWTERGIIVPLRETTGAGVKRRYDYVNLLEIYLCKTLLSMGFSVQKAKVILDKLRSSGFIREWATNFEHWNKEVLVNQKEHFKDLFSKIESKKGSIKEPFTNDSYTYIELKKLIKLYEKMKPIQSKEPNGILMLIFDGENFEHYILTYEMFDILPRNDLKKTFVSSFSVLTINIGRIKAQIDLKMRM